MEDVGGDGLNCLVPKSVTVSDLSTSLISFLWKLKVMVWSPPGS